MLISFSRYEPDPLMVSCALGQATEQLKFIVAYRSGLMQPATFVQQINTLSALIEGRVALNVVAGSAKAEQHGYGDFLAHDDRYARAEEFLAVCNSFWRNGSEVDFAGKYYRIEKGKLLTPFLAPDRIAPEVYISGHSEQAEQLARKQGTCLLRVADTPEKLQDSVARARENGLEVCLRFGIICRPTREEAVGIALSLLPASELRERKLITSLRDDSQMHKAAAARAGDSGWLSPYLWTGLVPYFGPVWTTLLGTPGELAEVMLEYKRIGVSQFILSGWPELDEVDIFGREVLPLVRNAE